MAIYILHWPSWQLPMLGLERRTPANHADALSTKPSDLDRQGQEDYTLKPYSIDPTTTDWPWLIGLLIGLVASEDAHVCYQMRACAPKPAHVCLHEHAYKQACSATQRLNSSSNCSCVRCMMRADGSSIAFSWQAQIKKWPKLWEGWRCRSFLEL